MDYVVLDEHDQISGPRRKRAALIALLVVAAVCVGIACWTNAGTSPSKPFEAGRSIVLPGQKTSQAKCASIPTTSDWAVKRYCSVAKVDKTLVADSSCKYWFYSYGGGTPGTDINALGFCKKGKKKGCHVEDRSGSACSSHTPKCSKIPVTTDSAVKAYCNVNSVDKTLVADGSCRLFFYSYDSHETDDDALNYCKKYGASGCHIEDRGGRKCFSCSESLVQSRYSASFKAYCAAPTPKQWFMSPNCKSARWTRGKSAAPSGMKLWSYGGGLCPCTKTKGDMRCKMQACLQYRRDWCWATLITIVAGYYHPDRYPNHDQTGPNCRGVECHIVGQTHHGNPETCCQNKDYCQDEVARSGAEVTKVLTKYTGFAWKAISRILSKSSLVKILQQGHPVALVIVYQGKYAKYGSHVMLIAGTNGKGVFYVHDPLNRRGRGSFQSLPYSGLLHYKTPGYPGQGDFGSGVWKWTYLPAKYAGYKSSKSFSNFTATSEMILPANPLPFL